MRAHRSSRSMSSPRPRRRRRSRRRKKKPRYSALRSASAVAANGSASARPPADPPRIKSNAFSGAMTRARCRAREGTRDARNRPPRPPTGLRLEDPTNHQDPPPRGSPRRRRRRSRLASLASPRVADGVHDNRHRVRPYVPPIARGRRVGAVSGRAAVVVPEPAARVNPRRALGLACQSKGMPAGPRGALGSTRAARWAARPRSRATCQPQLFCVLGLQPAVRRRRPPRWWRVPAAAGE